MTVDEELDLLDEQLRRLKIEYEIFFNNPAKRPPTDVEWKVLSLIRKFSDSPRLSFSQRYRYNAMAQRYAIQSDLWRKKMRIREEGYRRPQDAILSVSGIRVEEKQPKPAYSLVGQTQPADAAQAGEVDQPEGGRAAVAQAVLPQSQAVRPVSVQCSGAASERKQIETLYLALLEAKRKSGEKITGNMDSFAAFVNKKTSEIRRQHRCGVVEYSVEMQDGQVRLKAKAKT